MATLETIKRRAKEIKRETGVQHSKALEEAAKEAGFQSYNHAHGELFDEAIHGKKSKEQKDAERKQAYDRMKINERRSGS